MFSNQNPNKTSSLFFLSSDVRPVGGGQSLKFPGGTEPWRWVGGERGGGEGSDLMLKIVLRWGTPGTGEWNTRMGLEVPRVRLTWWLTDITVITFSHVKLTAGLWRWRTNNSIFLREIVKLLRLSCPHGLTVQWLLWQLTENFSFCRKHYEIFHLSHLTSHLTGTHHHPPPARCGCGSSGGLHGAWEQSYRGGRESVSVLHSHSGL